MFFSLLADRRNVHLEKRRRRVYPFAAVSNATVANDAFTEAGESESDENAFTISREEVGRSTWTLLHSVASYYPDNPTRQQQRDVDCLTRLYPCEICAKHFQEIVRNHPVQCRSSEELQQWTCDVHNTVNRSLKKPTFNCSFLQARWGAVDCGTNGSCRVHYRDTHKSLKNARS